jgi:hypothetical protein
MLQNRTRLVVVVKKTTIYHFIVPGIVRNNSFLYTRRYSNCMNCFLGLLFCAGYEQKITSFIDSILVFPW